jgi:UDP-glucose 4-epimerase
MAQKAMVTGGAGFIGSHLVDALVEDGWQVTVLDDLSTGRVQNLARSKDRIEFVKGDIRDADMVAELAQGAAAVFHQAAVVSVPLTVKDPVGSAHVNEIGTLNVLEACRRHRVGSLVLASSCAVYGDDPKLPKTEAMAARPLSPYAVQKLAGEYYASVYGRLFDLNIATLRYFNVYGPRQDPSSPYSGVISIFMERAVRSVSPVVYGDGRQSRDFIFVADVVRANLLAASADLPRSGVYNIGTGRRVHIGDLWEQIRKIAGSTASPEYRDAREGDIRESLADIAKAEAELGFVPAVSFDEGLAVTFRWYKEAARRQEK